MNTNTIVSMSDGPRRDYSFFLDSNEADVPSVHQKRVLLDLICQNIEDGENRESSINQIQYITKSEASQWISELQNAIW